jgi:solute carrier family 50 protein (sugar transporter)
MRPEDFILNYLFPSLGVLTSTWIYFSPLQTVNKAIETKNASSLNPLVYAMMLVNGPIWMIYSFHLKNQFVFSANVASIPLASYYLIMSISLEKDISIIKRSANVLIVGQTLVFLSAGFSFISMTNESGKILIGAVATILVLLFIASPLTSLYQVISSKSSESIDQSLAIAQLVNAIIWLIYGICINDPIVYAPNLIGIAVAIAQLILKAIYPEPTPMSLGISKNVEIVEMECGPRLGGVDESTSLLTPI